jgi:hypothetical protein
MTVFRQHYLYPPRLRKREVVIEGAVSGPSGRYAGTSSVWNITHLWLIENLPHCVAIRGQPPGFDRAKVKRWLNSETTGIWSWDMREGWLSVIFTDEVDASGFRIMWC